MLSMFVGMIIATWYLDRPVGENKTEQTYNIENNYYFKSDEHYYLMTRPPIPPSFSASKTQ